MANFMTPEQAAFHRLMILFGFQEEYDRALDMALTDESPLSELTLQLAACQSTPRETVSILYHYILEHPPDEEAVYDMVMTELRKRYLAGSITPEEIVALLDRAISICGSSAPWSRLWQPIEDYEFARHGPVSMETFLAAFDAWFLHGQALDMLALEQKRRKKEPIWFFLKKRKSE